MAQFGDLILDVINSNPNKVVAIDSGTNRSRTFLELDRDSEKVAKYLSSLNEKIIGISLFPSIDLLITLIAVVKRGITYVPLDPNSPEDRVSQILEECNINTIIYSSKQNVHIKCDGLVDLQWLLDKNSDREPSLSLPRTNEDIFCIMYTSGSSGNPKGVKISYRALMNRLNWQFLEHPFDESDVVGAKTQIGFVDSFAELWAPFIKAVPIVFIPRNILMSPRDFVHTLIKYKITRLTVVPSLLSVLLNSMNNEIPLKQVVCSGETLTFALCEKFFKSTSGCCLSNYYGCTEIMGDVTAITFQSLEQVEQSMFDGKVTIGSALNDTVQLTIENIDSNGIGDLVVEGLNVASGYQQSADFQQNDDRFVKNENTHVPKGFRTGDRVQMVNGLFYYYGRSDSQVKINGNRIYLSEIEVAVAKFTSHDTPCVVLYDGNKLLAFSEAKLDDNQLEKIENQLPKFAMPEFVYVEQIPHLEISGKVDVDDVDGDLIGVALTLKASLNFFTDLASSDIHLLVV